MMRFMNMEMTFLIWSDVDIYNAQHTMSAKLTNFLSSNFSDYDNILNDKARLATMFWISAAIRDMDILNDKNMVICGDNGILGSHLASTTELRRIVTVGHGLCSDLQHINRANVIETPINHTHDYESSDFILHCSFDSIENAGDWFSGTTRKPLFGLVATHASEGSTQPIKCADDLIRLSGLNTVYYNGTIHFPGQSKTMIIGKFE